MRSEEEEEDKLVGEHGLFGREDDDEIGGGESVTLISGLSGREVLAPGDEGAWGNILAPGLSSLEDSPSRSNLYIAFT